MLLNARAVLAACLLVAVLPGRRAQVALWVDSLRTQGSAGSSATAVNVFSPVQFQSGNFLNPKDDIYIDDDTLEGSGGGNDEVKDDLESSGSGMGDDDEDTTEGSGGRAPIVGTPQIPSGPSKPVEENIATVTKVKPVDTPPQSPVEVTGVGNESPESPEEDKEGQTDIDVHKDPTVVMNPKQEDRATSFFAQPGILAAVIGGAVVGLLCAILVVMFIVYRMRKKDEGSYALDEPKRSPTVNSYTKNSNREFYA